MWGRAQMDEDHRPALLMCQPRRFPPRPVPPPNTKPALVPILPSLHTHTPCAGPMGRTSLDAAFQSPTPTLHSGFGAGVPPPSFMGHAPRYGGAEARARGDPHAVHPAGFPGDGGTKPAPAFFTLNLGTTC